MSYDVSAFILKPGFSLDDVKASVLSQTTQSSPDFMPYRQPLGVTVKTAIRDALTNELGLRGDTFEKTFYSESEDNNHEAALSVQFGAEEISISVPYWYDEDAVDSVFLQIQACLSILKREANMVFYDRQLNTLFSEPAQGAAKK